MDDPNEAATPLPSNASSSSPGSGGDADAQPWEPQPPPADPPPGYAPPPSGRRRDPLDMLPVEPDSVEALELYSLPTFPPPAHRRQEPGEIPSLPFDEVIATDGDERPPTYRAGLASRFPAAGDDASCPDPSLSYDPAKVKPVIDRFSVTQSCLRAAILFSDLFVGVSCLVAWTQSTLPVPASSQTRLGLVVGSTLIDAFMSLLYMNPFPLRYACYPRSWRLPARLTRVMVYDVIFALLSVAVAVSVPPCWVGMDGTPAELPNGRPRPGFQADGSNWTCQILIACNVFGGLVAAMHLSNLLIVNLFCRRMRRVAHFGHG
ncbi:hypothetical protein DFJ74DRAFT_39352 [Hyaloraphidium curvatum]|nr:hypothetical protein DFJ74DRAFT_39352 [Hyaloraphidium curvatum]